ncbi:hypothetical protein FCR2A7T_10370 [Flavobacterium cauense R2A-7]|nr:hypothetical protein FCR2A7T_10370 [Flavobacterium cauense R2A-7]
MVHGICGNQFASIIIHKMVSDGGHSPESIQDSGLNQKITVVRRFFYATLFRKKR